MKQLKNIAIYYILIGIFFYLTFFFGTFWRFSIIGLIVLAIYLILRYVINIKILPYIISETWGKYLTWFFYLFPVISFLLIIWYSNRSFSQAIIIPKNYRGIVIVEYNKKNAKSDYLESHGQLSSSIKIKTDNYGYASTARGYPNTRINIFDIEGNSDYLDGLKIYFENDLTKEVPIYWENASQGTEDKIYEYYKKNNIPIAFSLEASVYINTFVIADPNSYDKYYIKNKSKRNVLKKPFVNLIDSL